MIINRDVLLRMNSYFHQRLGMRDYTRGWLKGDCPVCNAGDKFGVNLFDNRTNCFRCRYSPKPMGVIMDLEYLHTYEEVRQFLRTYEGYEFLETQIPALEEKKVSLPESFKLLSLGDSQLGVSARKVMEKRGFDIDELTLQGVGYCTKGKYWGRIIFPFYEGGKLVYFTARRITALGPKFKNPTIDEFGIGKNLLIYNVDCLTMYNKVYVVESVTNALTLGDNAIALGGKIASDYQVSKLLRSPVKRFVIILDPDAYTYAIRVALKIVNHKKIKIVNWEGDKDVNDIGKKRTLYYEKKTPWSTYADLFGTYINLDSK